MSRRQHNQKVFSMDHVTKQYRKIKPNGFTIIEVLMVVAILGILAAIAIPAVTKYVTDARRSDGKTALLAAAQAMERHFTNNYTYANATIPGTSDQEYYTLAINTANATGFVVEAEADPDGKQAGDTPCLTMTINELGQKTPSACW